MDLKDFIVLISFISMYLLDNIEALVPNYYIEDHCDQMLNLNYGAVEAVRLLLTKNQKYPDGMRCRMIIQAPEGKRLSVRIEDFDLDASAVYQNNQNNPNAGLMQQQCANGDYALFYDGPDETSLPLRGLPGRVCHRPEQKTFLSSSRYVALIFMSDRNMLAGRGIKLLLTAYSDSPCKDDQFKCETSGICIKKSLECDGNPNCDDNSDEAMPKCLAVGAIVGIAVGGAIVLIAIIVVTVICIVSYQRRKRARIIKLSDSRRDLARSTHFQRALDKGNYPYVVWDGNDTDAIFSSVTREHIRKYASINTYDTEPSDNYDIKMQEGVLVGPHYLQKPREDKENQDSTGDSKIVGPNGEEMIKYPSGFWDITLSDLGIGPVTEM